MIKGQEGQRESIAWLLKKVPTECPEISVNNYCLSFCNNTEEQSFLLHSHKTDELFSTLFIGWSSVMILTEEFRYSKICGGWLPVTDVLLKGGRKVNFMVVPCISIIQHFIFQLMHKNCKILRLLKIVKIIKAAPTCFGSHKTIIMELYPVLS